MINDDMKRMIVLSAVELKFRHETSSEGKMRISQSEGKRFSAKEKKYIHT